MCSGLIFTKTYPIFDMKRHRRLFCGKMAKQGRREANEEKRVISEKSRKINCRTCKKSSGHGSKYNMYVVGLSAKRAAGSEKVAKILSFSAYLTEKFLTDDVISSEEAEIVKYGLESIGSSLLGLLVTLTIGGIFGFFPESFILWMLIFPLRRYAGGFHASTRGRCFLISTGMLVLSFVFLVYVNLSKTACLLLAAIFFGIIFCMAPVGNQNKMLDELERRVYKKRTRIVLVLEGILFAGAFALEWNVLSTLIMIGFAVVGVSVIAGQESLIISN